MTNNIGERARKIYTALHSAGIQDEDMRVIGMTSDEYRQLSYWQDKSGNYSADRWGRPTHIMGLRIAIYP